MLDIFNSFMSANASTGNMLVGISFVLFLLVLLILVIARMKGIEIRTLFSPLSNLFDKIRKTGRTKEETEPSTPETVGKTEGKESGEQMAQSRDEAVKRALQEQERAKKLEEKFDELKQNYDSLQGKLKEKDEESKQKDEQIEQIEEESAKLAKFSMTRYNKGHYIPVVLYSERQLPLPYQFVVEIGWVNGGWRALLTDNLRKDPDDPNNYWFPPLDFPGTTHVFKDDQGFDPQDPSQTVLFDIVRHDWEADLKPTKNDPESRPPAFQFGIDLGGNPIHKLQFGPALSIQRVRSENRKLKMQSMGLQHQNNELNVQINDLKYQIQMERDLKSHREEELKLYKNKSFESRDTIRILQDEQEAARESEQHERLRKGAAQKRAHESEKAYQNEFSMSGINESSIEPYLDQKVKESEAKVISYLAPLAKIELQSKDVETSGKSNKEIVYSWVKERTGQDSVEGLIEILKELNLDQVIQDVLQGTSS